ncbi:MAG TPA: flippase activity-associated protein Agl23 [Chloroflexia bacterium]|nr:flippase activity-associated protein Agl23 [Chloroflexia bacterium]
MAVDKEPTHRRKPLSEEKANLVYAEDNNIPTSQDVTGDLSERKSGPQTAEYAEEEMDDFAGEVESEDFLEEETERPSIKGWWRWPRTFGYFFTLEAALFTLIIIFAVVTRFYGLSERALHHDEGVHAYYSWRFYNGDGYAQEPWKHGPFLYDITALVFWIFGDSDQTTRVSTAIFGVLMCLLPLGLRKELGRWGALTASFLLAVSPMFLYFSRFLREDIFVAFATMGLFIGLVRFVDKPRPLWWNISMLSLAMLFCTKEVSFFYLAMFGGFLGAWMCWQLAPRLLLVLGGYLVLAVVVFFFVMQLYPPPPIPFENINGNELSTYARQLVKHPVFWAFIILALGGLALAWFSFREVAVNRRRFMVDEGWASPGIRSATALFAPYRQEGTVAYAVSWLGQHWKTTFTGLGLAFAFYFVLFTGFFSDIPQGSVGLFSGLWYWMAQQGVARGNQPWYYYFFMMPFYEPLALFFGTIGGVYILVKSFGYGFRRQRRVVMMPVSELPEEKHQPTPVVENDPEMDTPEALRGVTGRRLPALNKEQAKTEGTSGEAQEDEMVEVEVILRQAGNDLWPGRRRRECHPYFAPLMLTVWAFVGLAIYTWASEKMPWLTVQVALPFILLAAYLMDGVWRGIETYFTSGEARQPVLWGVSSRAFFWTLVGGLTASALLLFMTLLQLTSAEAKVTVGGGFRFDWLTVWIAPVIALLFFTALFTFMGLKIATKAAGAVAFGLLTIYLIHTGFGYAYDHGDVPLEMGIYTQTSPDVYRVVKELNTVTSILPDLKRTPVLYDTELRTPLDFYLRDYVYADRVSDFSTMASQRVNSVPSVALPLDQYEVVMISDTKAGTLSETQKRTLADNFISRHYVFNQWFDESQYRNFDQSASVQISYLQGKASKATVKDASNNVLVQQGEVLTTERLQEISATPGALDRIYNANGGNSSLLHLKEAAQSLNQMRMPDQFSRLWRYIMYREQPEPLGTREFTLYIKKDIAGLWRQYSDLVDYPISGLR